VAFAFLPDQIEGLYSWALAQIKGLYTLIYPIISLLPRLISTDCDQVLRNTILKVFPKSVILLCLWHINKNVQQHYKGKFTMAEEYNNFFKV
jgi:hypothetical protein